MMIFKIDWLYSKNLRSRGFFQAQQGMGTVEVVLILAVLVGIALIFRQYLFGFVSEIINNILGDPLDAIRSQPLLP